jgi:putative peptidoglycan lipid II flippase
MQPTPPPPPPERSAARGALVVMGGTLASRVTGLLREILTVALFPVRATDAFRIAWVIPNLFRELLAEGALTNAFVPIAQGLQGRDRRAFAGAMLSLLTLVNALLLALAWWLAPQVVDLLLASSANVDRDLAITLLRLTFPVLAAISASALAMGVLQASERLWAPAWAPVALNVVAMLAMLIAPGEATALAWGVVLGGVLQALVQWPVMLRAGLAPLWARFWHAAMPAALGLMLPFAFTTGARQLLNVVAQRLVSNDALFPAGAVTAYALAAMLFSLVLGLFAISPAVAFYARLGNDAARAQAGAPATAFRETLGDGVRFILTLTLPLGALTFAFAGDAVGAVFQVLTPAAGQGVAIALAGVTLAPLGFALPATGLVNFLLRPFYVRRRVRAPVAVSVAFTAMTGALYLLWAPRYGLAGLSWATAVAMGVQALVLLVWLRRSEGLALRPLANLTLRLLAASLPAVAAARGLANWAQSTWSLEGWLASLSALALGATVGGGGFVLLARWLRVPEVERVLLRFRPRA